LDQYSHDFVCSQVVEELSKARKAIETVKIVTPTDLNRDKAFYLLIKSQDFRKKTLY
jgi:hypothetical protein